MLLPHFSLSEAFHSEYVQHLMDKYDAQSKLRRKRLEKQLSECKPISLSFRIYGITIDHSYFGLFKQLNERQFLYTEVIRRILQANF